MDVGDQFLQIVKSVKDIEIHDLEDSIFSLKYMLTPNDLVYILLLASEKLKFPVTEELIDSLEARNSFRDLINYIDRHIVQNG